MFCSFLCSMKEMLKLKRFVAMLGIQLEGLKNVSGLYDALQNHCVLLGGLQQKFSFCHSSSINCEMETQCENQLNYRPRIYAEASS